MSGKDAVGGGILNGQPDKVDLRDAIYHDEAVQLRVEGLHPYAIDDRRSPSVERHRLRDDNALVTRSMNENRLARLRLCERYLDGLTSPAMYRGGFLFGRARLFGRRASRAAGEAQDQNVEGGAEVVVLENARLGLWSVTNDGIVFLTTEQESDDIHRYSFSDRRVRRLGKLPFRVSRIHGFGGLVASRDGRWSLVSATDYWESDIMVADGLR